MRRFSHCFAPSRLLTVGIIVSSGVFASSGVARAQISTDGTLGAKLNLGGPAYQIPPDLGKIYGKNLFHSFSDFNLSSGESATFSGPASVANILSRVTSGKSSSINGNLKSTIAGANFFFINPSGVVFGPDAQVNVGGSFVVTTADTVKLGDGHVFAASKSSAPLLSSAPPISFGFLNSRPAPIVVNRSKMSVSANQAFSLIGGSITLTGDPDYLTPTLAAPSGRVNLVSVDSRGQVALDASDAAAPTLSGFKQLGTLRMTAATVDVGDTSARSSGEGGSVNVNGKNLFMDGGATIGAKNRSATTGGAIRVALEGLLSIKNQSAISASNEGSGRGTSIEIKANSIVLQGAEVLGPRNPTGIASLVSPKGTGQGGDVSVVAQRLSISDGSRISTSTNGAGSGGNLAIKATNITLDGGENPDFTGLVAQTTSTARGGQGGSVTVDTRALQIRSGAEISASSFGTGTGGSINVKADGITLDGLTSLYFTGIAAGTFDNGRGGNGGTITLAAKSLHILRGAEINADTQGRGQGGNIFVTADNILLERGGSDEDTGIIAQTLAQNGGHGGSIALKAKNLQIRSGALINATTSGTGAGGDISVTAANVVLNGDGAGDQVQTGFAANTSSEAKSATGGNILINSQNLKIINGASISGFTLGGAKGGLITIKAQDVTLDGQGATHFTGISTQTSSTAVHAGNSGDVDISARDLTIVDGAEISSSTFGTGKGGDIVITADKVLLDGTKSIPFTGIAAGTYASFRGGAGGNISLGAKTLQIIGGAALFANTKSDGIGGRINIKADTITIDANGVSPDVEKTGIVADSTLNDSGRSGDIEIEAGDLNVVNGGAISAATVGTSQGGSIHIKAGTLKVTTRGTISTDSTGKGAGGSIRIESGHILLDGGTITSGSHGDGDAGSIGVSSDTSADLRNDSTIAVTSDKSNGGDLKLMAADSIEINASSLSTQAAKDGGTIILNAARQLRATNGLLNAHAGINGGNITAQARDIIFDRSRVIASAVLGTGGNILLSSKVFLPSAESVIDASSQFGVAGNVAIESPNTNIGGSLVVLPSNLLNAESYLAARCVVRSAEDSSSFTVNLKNGVPTQPGDLLPSADYLSHSAR